LLPVSDPTAREEHYLTSSAFAAPDGDLGTLDVSALGTVLFDVRMPDGSPADRARIYLGEIDERPRTPVQFLTDRIGRCSIRVPLRHEFAVFAAHAEGFAIGRVGLSDERKSATVPLQLAVGGWLEGTAVDTEGQPLENVRIYVRGGGELDRSLWYSSFVDDISSTTYALNYRGIYTDAKGQFRAAFPQAGVQLEITAWRRGVDNSYWGISGERRKVELIEDGMEPLRLVLARQR
jgi:hypothetical protein